MACAGSAAFRRGIEILCVLSLVFESNVAGAAKNQVTLAMYGSAGTPYADAFKVIEERFENQHPDFDLELMIIPNTEYNDKILTLIASGTPPDVFLTWQQNKEDWVEQGLLMDVTSRFLGSKLIPRDRFFPPVLEAVRYKGRYWGTPWGFNSVVWFANRDLLEQAGMNVPDVNWSTEDLLTYGRRLLIQIRKCLAPLFPSVVAIAACSGPLISPATIG